MSDIVFNIYSFIYLFICLFIYLWFYYLINFSYLFGSSSEREKQPGTCFDIRCGLFIIFLLKNIRVRDQYKYLICSEICLYVFVFYSYLFFKSSIHHSVVHGVTETLTQLQISLTEKLL